MPRLLVGTEWFEAVASVDFYEVHFETLVMQHAAQLFPDYFAVPFKTSLSSEYGTRKPDLALIDRQYRTWWVVEVELAHHSLHNHVLPQIQVFATASYGPSEAEYLRRQDSTLSLASLVEMMRGAPPKVLVIVNQAVPNWVDLLRMFRAAVGVVEVFRSGRNESILRVNGEQPVALGPLVSLCHFDPVVPRLLRVDSPASLGEGVDGRFAIEFEGSVSEWKRVDAADRVWLNPRGGNPLPGAGEFELFKTESGRFVFKVREDTRWRSS
jgi:hypothetical protein